MFYMSFEIMVGLSHTPERCSWTTASVEVTFQAVFDANQRRYRWMFGSTLHFLYG